MFQRCIFIKIDLSDRVIETGLLVGRIIAHHQGHVTVFAQNYQVTVLKEQVFILVVKPLFNCQ